MLGAACSTVVPAAECDTTPWSPAPSNLLGCQEAVAAATDALAPDHAPIVRIWFTWTYCQPGTLTCPIAYPFLGTVIFTFESVVSGRTTDSYMQIVREDDGRVHVASALTPIASPD